MLNIWYCGICIVLDSVFTQPRRGRKEKKGGRKAKVGGRSPEKRGGRQTQAGVSKV